MQWKTARNYNLSSRFDARGGLSGISNVSNLESKIAILESMLKGLSIQQPQPSYTSLVSCSHY